MSHILWLKRFCGGLGRRVQRWCVMRVFRVLGQLNKSGSFPEVLSIGMALLHWFIFGLEIHAISIIS